MGSTDTISSMVKPLETHSNRLKWIHEQGAEILFLDLTHITPEDSLSTLAACEKLLEACAPHSVLMLLDLEGAVYDPAVVAQWKAGRTTFAPVIRGSAAYGISGMIGVALQGYHVALRLLGLNHLADSFQWFKTREEALAWLLARP